MSAPDTRISSSTSAALDRWADANANANANANAEPGRWAHWLTAELR